MRENAISMAITRDSNFLERLIFVSSYRYKYLSNGQRPVNTFCGSFSPPFDAPSIPHFPTFVCSILSTLYLCSQCHIRADPDRLKEQAGEDERFIRQFI